MTQFVARMNQGSAQCRRRRAQRQIFLQRGIDEQRAQWSGNRTSQDFNARESGDGFSSTIPEHNLPIAVEQRYAVGTAVERRFEQFQCDRSWKPLACPFPSFGQYPGPAQR